MDSSGNILVSGIDGSNMIIWRYTPSGSLDTSYNGTGYVTQNNAAGGTGDGGFDLAFSNNKIMTTGIAQTNTYGNYDMTI